MDTQQYDQLEYRPSETAVAQRDHLLTAVGPAAMAPL
jgi:hypothetical protein